MDKWKKIANWTRYLSPEHQQKEREYGIPWRSAFKEEINKEVQKIKMRLEIEEEVEEPFLFLIDMVKGGMDSDMQLSMETEIDKIVEDEEYITQMELIIKYLKKLLKEP